jgi:hypothetical protein
MNKDHIKYRELKISRLMLMLTMFLGMVTFSGFSGNARSVVDQKATQTEVGISSVRTDENRTISFQDALGLFVIDQAFWLGPDWKMDLLLFDNLIRVKLARISLQPPFQPICHRYLTKTIPQSSDEEEPSIF